MERKPGWCCRNATATSATGSSVAGIMVTAVALMISIPVGIATAGFYMPFRLAEDYLLVPKITGGP